MTIPSESKSTPTPHRSANPAEIIALLLIGLLFVCGCFFDCQIARGVSLHPVKNLDGLSQVLLQIQGTVVSLTISVVALLSGNIKDSTLGVSLTDYYLNKRPWFFKQYRIIIASLALLAVNVLIHTWSFYNLVLCLFIVSFILVLMSIQEIYSVFRGRYSIDQEMEQYVKEVFDQDGNDDEQYSLMESLTDDLAREAKGNAIEYERYCQVYLYGCRQLLKKKNSVSGAESDHLSGSCQETVSAIQKTGQRWIYSLFSTKEPAQIQQGFEFLYQLYSMIWKSINNAEETKESADFHLFRDVYGEIVSSLRRLSPEEAQECLHLPRLMYYAAAVTVYSPKGAYQNTELENFNAFMRTIGWYLRQCRNRNDVYQEGVWGEPFRYYYVYQMYRDCSFAAEDDENIHANLWIPTRLLFNYYFGLLMNQSYRIIGDWFYKDYVCHLGSLGRRDERDNAVFKAEAFLAISAHGYLYYIAKRAYEKSVPDAVRTGAVQLFESSDVRESFTKFLETLYRRNQVLSPGFENKLEVFLGQYELHSHSAAERLLLCGIAAREIFLFIVVYLSWRHNDTQLLDRALNVSLYRLYISDEEERNTKYWFARMAAAVGCEWEEEERKNAEGGYEEKQAEKLYQHLKKWLTEKLKQQEKQKAKEDQAVYMAKNQEGELCEEISRLAEKRLYEEFSVILRKKEERERKLEGRQEENEHPVTMKLLKYENYTRFIYEKGFINSCTSHVPGGFVRALYQELTDRRSILWMNRRQDFSGSDQEYLDLLEREKFAVLLGNEYSLKNYDPMESDRFREITKDCTCIYVADALVGLALKSDALEVEILKVRTQIRPLTWAEIETQVSYDENTGRYEYKLHGQETMEFEKDELIEYLQGKRRVVEIYADVFVREKMEYVGLAVN